MTDIDDPNVFFFSKMKTFLCDKETIYNSSESVESGDNGHMNIYENTSTSSSVCAVEYSVRRILEMYAAKAALGRDIPYPQLKLTTIILFIVTLFLSAIVVTQVKLYSSGLLSYNEVVFADGAVSDNMQLL